MADDQGQGEVDDREVETDPQTKRRMRADRDENERFQKYTKLKQYPPGYKRHNTQETYVEVIQQPPVSIKTGFQTVASSGRILFAANGPDIHSFDILAKSHLSTWKWPKDKDFPKIPEPLKNVYNPNIPSWALQPEEIEARKMAKAKKEGPAAKRRKLNTVNAKGVADDAMDVTEPDANSANADVIKDASSEGEVAELDPFPARPVNPELWQSDIVDKEDAKPELTANDVEGVDIESIRFEKTSERPPDFKPEGWVADELENWRRPDFRPEHRLEWKHQPSTATSDIPMVQCMCVTMDGKHVAAATGSDKTIWVFEHDGNGRLTLLSQRTMPKRPNAIAVANKDRTLLCADKFGDIYALPLIERKDIPVKAAPALLSRSATPATAKPYQSQANEKTVHSKRNKQALENQKKQSLENQKKQSEKEGTSPPEDGTNPKKDPTGDFYHKLILGHVSMLTDIAVGKIQTLDSKSGKSFQKELIITADRDEHIRVSRGMPQSYVIENFLLGHKEFVSRIHIPARYPNVLISGGGDSYIYVWDYLTGQLLLKQEMRNDLVKELDADTEGEPPLAVSGIVSYYDANIDQTRVFVICENVPKAFTFNLDDEMLRPSTDQRLASKPKSTGKMVLPGNPLGITTFATDNQQGIIVTYDPWTAGPNVYHESHCPLIQVISPHGLDFPPKIHEITVPNGCSEEIAFTFRGDWEKALYTIEPLRKNCFDRDISQKDEGGNWGVKASTG
ncbi:hypothetical protein CONLIGDRAFT_675826 [Coniochaeta ligniaria NRRL 30616]|uniref:Uncharacterized protein n=1 Tax=Coniochaeta ligniaria NRRL 30616 TaxID=1408157 RepID=A0A1J7K3W1_9PEZI|nr:hypothetical protein CONLIGDRAFT_675826 [Coniochaeta ligniaria NRRL 30616]